MKRIVDLIKQKKIESVVVLLALIFSTWLMFSTFSYSEGSMLIATKAWSDFASQIPLIRSFSFGHNFPPEFPLFSGPSIHYHFLFYLMVGFFEKFGIRIDYAFNVPSVLGFTFLILMIYIFAKRLFKSVAVGLLSVLFFLFNGSLSFIYFLNDNRNVNLFKAIIENTHFSSFGPYDGRIISAFWNLNIYTNQRHLALSIALSLFILFIFSKLLSSNRKNYLIPIFLGFLLGLSFFLHFAVFLMTVVAILILSVLFKKLRLSGFLLLLIAAVVSFPQYCYIGGTDGSFKPFFAPAYLINDLTFFSFFYYWIANVGFHFLLIPFGFILANKEQRKIFISFFAFFLIGHLIQFSPEAAGNHKFFNYFFIIGNMFSAFAIVTIWKKTVDARPLVVIMGFFLIFSGIIDFFPIYNDRKIYLADYPIDKNVSWIMKNTPPESVFLNSQYIYDPASLAGRKIFLGWPYFAWSAGYNTTLRSSIFSSILSGNNKKIACQLFKNNKINYFEIKPNNNDPNYPTLNLALFQTDFKYSYNNGNYFIYNVDENCN